MMMQQIEGKAKRALSVQAALTWAFRDECASLDFGEIETLTGEASGFGMEYVMIEQARLGCRVDGGGRSDPHSDAEVIASTVSALSIGSGGKWMANRIAECAQRSEGFEWGRGRVSKYVPVETRFNQHGERAKKAMAHEYDPQCGWQPWQRQNRKGKMVRAVSYCTPVVFSPSGAQVAAWRRGYLNWWGALFEIANELNRFNGLSTITLTETMPPLRPWEKNC
jgi:hypothetical protein